MSNLGIGNPLGIALEDRWDRKSFVMLLHICPNMNIFHVFSFPFHVPVCVVSKLYMLVQSWAGFYMFIRNYDKIIMKKLQLMQIINIFFGYSLLFD